MLNILISAFHFDILDADVEVINRIIRLLIASACGFAIGFERKSRSKEAGIRTHTIVCFAAALMMIISKYAFSDLGDSTLGTGTRDADSARIAAQVVSGIGFLGAGIIFYKRDLLHGLTTAAGIWATAGIGLAIGAGLILIGVFSSIALIAMQIILHSNFKFLKLKAQHLVHIKAYVPDTAIIEEMKTVFHVKKIVKFKTENLPDGQILAEIDITTEYFFTPKELLDISAKYPFIKTLEQINED